MTEPLLDWAKGFFRLWLVLSLIWFVWVLVAFDLVGNVTQYLRSLGEVDTARQATILTATEKSLAAQNVYPSDSPKTDAWLRALSDPEYRRLIAAAGRQSDAIDGIRQAVALLFLPLVVFPLVRVARWVRSGFLGNAK